MVFVALFNSLNFGRVISRANNPAKPESAVVLGPIGATKNGG
jgi:hypothetical protein